MNDDRGNASGGDPVESGGKAIERNNDAESGEDSSDWSPDPRLGFECGARK